MPSVILFDGVCNLCNGFVRFVIARDPDAHFRFGPLQSEAAQRLIGAAQIRGTVPDSVVLVEDGRVWTESSAALRVFRRLRFPWPLAFVFVLVPSPLRNWVYRIVARNRYRWFGRREVCMVPTADLNNRFLDAEPRERR
jgi:predicted DCC family thiol-disulfide oxidoreductase YuxK